MFVYLERKARAQGLGPTTAEHASATEDPLLRNSENLCAGKSFTQNDCDGKAWQISKSNAQIEPKHGKENEMKM